MILVTICYIITFIGARAGEKIYDPIATHNTMRLYHYIPLNHGSSIYNKTVLLCFFL